MSDNITKSYDNLVIFLVVLLSIISNNKLLTLETSTKLIKQFENCRGFSILQWNKCKCSRLKKAKLFYTTLLQWNRITDQ